MKNIFLLILLVLLSVVGYFKQLFHWKYLKKIRSDLNKFESIGDFRDSINMKNPSEYWNYNDLTFKLMLPTFLIQKGINKNFKEVIRIRFLSFLFIILFILLILVVWDIIFVA